MQSNETMRIEGIVLAAGFSSRAGTFKPALDFDGKTLIVRALEGMLSVCSRVVVVAGFRAEFVRELVRNFGDVRVVVNHDFEKGMFSSVQRGAAEVDADAFFIMPGDYPFVPGEVYSQLLEAMFASDPGNLDGKDVFIPVSQGRKGHPVLLRGHLAAELVNAPPDWNLREFIREKGFQSVDVNHDGILTDIDTMADYRKHST